MLFQQIENITTSLKTASISNERKQALLPLIDYIQSKVKLNKNINLNFICNHKIHC